jgi:hypothetical protein
MGLATSSRGGKADEAIQCVGDLACDRYVQEPTLPHIRRSG